MSYTHDALITCDNTAITCDMVSVRCDGLARDRFSPQIIPPSIHDDRAVAFARSARLSMAEPEFKRLLVERPEWTEDPILPARLRETGMHRFAEPGVSVQVLRRLIDAAFDLHAMIGYIPGVKRGLEMIGARVTHWRQWFEPVAFDCSDAGVSCADGHIRVSDTLRASGMPPGTHLVTVSMEDEVFEAEGHAITTRLQLAVTRMVDLMKRWSQYVGVRFQAESLVPLHVGAIVITRMRVTPPTTPITHLIGVAPLFAGAAIRQRITIKPVV